eukprot:jgi/Psemu1/37964/gm1.37964_g
MGTRGPLQDLYMVPLHQSNTDTANAATHTPTDADTDKSPRVPAKSPRVTDPPPPISDKQTHTGAGAYQIQAIPKLIAFYHAAAGYPTKETWVRAIDRGSYATWPGLTSQRQGVQSTRRPKTKAKTTETRNAGTNSARSQGSLKKIHNISVDVVSTTEMQPANHVNTGSNNEPKELIAWDLPGRYSVTSWRGHQYVFLMYDYGSNYIDVEPIQSHKSEDILRGFTACYTRMKEDNIHAKIVRMDNETSKKLITYITKNNLDYQLASPGDHRLNHAERAIQTFKNHLITGLNGVDDDFPVDDWDLLIPQALITLNLSQVSHTQPRLSAYELQRGVYDYNKHPLAPMGCRVIIHDRAQERGAWQDHGTRGFYISDMPETSSTDQLLMILQDLKDVTNKPHPPIPYVEQGTQINEALQNIQDLLRIGAQEPLNMESRRTHVKPDTRTTPGDKIPGNTRLQGCQTGPIQNPPLSPRTYANLQGCQRPNSYYQVKFADGDLADYTHGEISRDYKSDQYYSKPKDKPKALMGMYRRATVRFPVPKQAQHITVAPYRPQLACGGSIWDDDLNKWAAYRDLIKHPKATIQELWLKSGEDEFGRLFQGFQPNHIEGMDVLDWIKRCDVPIHKKVTYPRYIVAIRPEKVDPYRTRITAGGDQLEYHGEVSTVVCTPEAKYCTGDISNMYLCSTLDEPKFVKFRWTICVSYICHDGYLLILKALSRGTKDDDPLNVRGPGPHEKNSPPAHRGVTPDTSIDTEHEIRYLRGRLDDLTEDNYDLREYTLNQTSQLQTQNQLLREYAEDSDSEDSEDTMSKKRGDYDALKDLMEPTQLKPIQIPTSIDVYEFKKALTNALAEVTSTKYIQGGGYAFLLETEAQYRTRERNPNAVYPTAPTEPTELDSTVELTSDTYKLWKQRRALFVEWNKYNREALLLTDKKFPRMLHELKDPGSEAFPRGTTALEAFQQMETKLCTTDVQRELRAEIAKKMRELDYTPSPLGPKEYFRLLTKYQHQINLLPATAKATAAQMIDYAHMAFKRSKHDPITLHRVEDAWKEHRAAVNATDEEQELMHYKRFWGQRLKELYSSYHATTGSANKVEIQNNQRLAIIEDNQRALVSVCQDLKSQAESATAASTLTMSNHQLESALSTLTRQMGLLMASQQTKAGPPPQVQHRQQQQHGGRRPQQATNKPPSQWKQYKHYCHSCGVNLSHDGGDCFRFKPNHQVGAMFANKMGGSTQREDRWMKWSHPVTRETHDTPS